MFGKKHKEKKEQRKQERQRTEEQLKMWQEQQELHRKIWLELQASKNEPQQTASKQSNPSTEGNRSKIFGAANSSNANDNQFRSKILGRSESQNTTEPSSEPVATPVQQAGFKSATEESTTEKSILDKEKVWMPKPYNFPPVSDLAVPVQEDADTSMEDERFSRNLETVLAGFNISVRVVHVVHGPLVTRYELELAQGTRISRILDLEREISSAMCTEKVYIEAPIPGKSLIGIDVPNPDVPNVSLREILQSDEMQSAKSALTVALGKHKIGVPVICDPAKMPHMLIAGQTGSGKSMCINAMIISLLYRANPDDVKLILIDPKTVELQCYNGVPHMLIPVVYDPHKAATVLSWAEIEMHERYEKFAWRKVRNLEGYNNIIAPTEKPMSRIVIIIDGLENLLEEETVLDQLIRLSGKGYAAGLHLIISLNKPVSGKKYETLKYNFPSKISFKANSSKDSLSVLGFAGAENLNGFGDMLYLPLEAHVPVWIKGCFLSDEEINNIVTHVRNANPSTYDPDILEKLDRIASSSAEGGGDIIINSSDMSGGDGGLFEQAVEFAIADGQISTSTLQRRLKIGYARTGRLIDEMEERGIVAAKDGSKPRRCLITREEWEEMKKILQ